MPIDLRGSWDSGRGDRKDAQKRRQNKGNTLETLIGKRVLLITRSGHWFYGTLRDVDGRGVLVTDVKRIEPVLDKNGEQVHDTTRRVTLRKVFPFELPVEGLDTIVVRKMFVAWGQVGQILRAKMKKEIEEEEEAKRSKTQ